MSRNGRTLLLMVTDYRGLIPQRILAWDGYDLATVKRVVEERGVSTRVVTPNEIEWSTLADWDHVAAIYASSQEPRYKQYLVDVVANLHFAGVHVIPSLPHMLAHDDKGFQGIALARTTIRCPRSYVFGERNEAYAFLARATFPLVAKAAEGFGSENVRLVRSEGEGHAFVNEQMRHRALAKGRSLATRIIQRILPPGPTLGLAVFQDFLPRFEGDWKILMWGDRACGLYRLNRRRDFRASGSGRIQLQKIPAPILKFAFEACQQLELPWASLDIAFDGEKCFLLEYQGMHFGLTAAERSSFHYVRDANGSWTEVASPLPIDESFAASVLRALDSHGLLPTQGEGGPYSQGAP